MKRMTSIALVLALSIVLSGCPLTEGDVPLPTYTSESSESSSETSDAETTTVEETTEETIPEPSEPVAEFSGNAEDTIVFEENTYYESEDFFIFFEKGSTVRGDTIENLTQVMRDEEELFGMSYDSDYVISDDDWRQIYFGGDFKYVNTDLSKPNILILKDPEDASICWAFGNEVMIFDTYTDPDNPEFQETYHEFAHLLRLQQSGSLGSTLEEGIAVYAQYELCKNNNAPAWDMIQYLEGGLYDSPYDHSYIYADPEGEFVASSLAPRDGEHRDYNYGFRFVRYLVETYGIEMIDTISQCAREQDLNGDVQTDLLVQIIKENTSETVFDDFAAWLPSGWDDFGREYADYMEQFGFEA